MYHTIHLIQIKQLEVSGGNNQSQRGSRRSASQGKGQGSNGGCYAETTYSEALGGVLGGCVLARMCHQERFQ